MITCWDDIEKRGGEDWLTPAERKLVAACEAGTECVLGDGELPPEGAPNPERRVRAEVLRYLILGGCDGCKVQGWGVRLVGAYVVDQLDLSFQSAKGVTGLIACRFQRPIVARQTRFEFLNLNKSHLPSLNAQGSTVTGNLFLKKVNAAGPVSLSGANIGGQFNCESASFNDADNGAERAHALNAQGATVKGAMLLRNITADGEVRLSGARISGQLSCQGATFTGTQNGKALHAEGIELAGGMLLRNVTANGEVRLSGARISGQLSCKGATFTGAQGGKALLAQGAEVKSAVFLTKVTATGEVNLIGTSIGGQLVCDRATFNGKGTSHVLSAQRLHVAQSLYWRGVTVQAGSVSLVAAHVGDLVDDPECWPKQGRLILDGLTYDRISASRTDADTRLKWLARGDTWNATFFPQPYTQLAKVLRDMGHDRDARKVLVAREQKLRQQYRKELCDQDTHKDRNLLKWLIFDVWWLGHLLVDRLLRWLVGYGHHPFRSLFALALLIFLAIIPAHYAWEEGSFAPNSGPVQMSAAWQDLAMDAANPAEFWSSKMEPGRDWETFFSPAWAADLVIPIIDLGQTDAWAPSSNRGPWGWNLWWAQWVLSMLGWIVTALGAAAITGIIRRE